MSSSSSSSSSSSAPGLAPPLSVSGVSVSDGVQPEKKSDVKLSADPKNVAIEWVKSRPVITVSVVVFLSWFLGYMGYFVVWVMWLVPLSLAWERLAVQRLLRRETRRVRQEILSSDFVRPEFETAAWINQLFENCWINYGPFAAQQIEENTRKAFSEKKPPIFSDMALESINMGAIGPKVYNVYVHKTEPHILKIEADVVLDSTLSMEFVAKLAAPPQPKVPIAIRDAFVSGRFCFEMEMLPGPPFTKQIKFCFLGDPEIDVKVKPLKGLDLLSIPGLHQAVRDLVRDQINAQMVAPNVLTVILDKSSPPPPSPSPAPLDRSSSSKGLVGSGIDGIGNAGKAVVGGCANVVGGAADLGKNVVGGAADLGKNMVGGAANAGKNVVGGAADLGKNVVGGAADLGKNVVGGVFGAPKKLLLLIWARTWSVGPPTLARMSLVVPLIWARTGPRRRRTLLSPPPPPRARTSPAPTPPSPLMCPRRERPRTARGRRGRRSPRRRRRRREWWQASVGPVSPSPMGPPMSLVVPLTSARTSSAVSRSGRCC
eukprot:TRINITY_DN135_c0_g1_i1.p2 TRINITY_DN135_c0_g1~~TRINITY_DN135_c0_g1_i1.p2  ORF type:complete len:543 (+),score=137.80 TRINITY_DN135_c0_g1_i1:137-1765(+)